MLKLCRCFLIETAAFFINMRKPLSNTQIVLLTLLWVSICFVILTGTARIDGPLILTLLISGALVFIPIIKSIKKKKQLTFYSKQNLIFKQIDVLICLLL